MRTAIGFFLFFAIVACEHVRQPSLSIGRGPGAAVEVRVRNDTENTIVLVSPTTPMRQEDAENCSLVLSSRIIDVVQPYNFTPELVTVHRRGTYRVAIAGPEKAVPRCSRWDVT